MSEKKYHAISPDGIPITGKPFDSEKEAVDAIPAWIERFKTQGYYRSNSWEKISLEDVREMLWIADSDSRVEFFAFPTCRCVNPSCPDFGKYH
jgi:hypothetical protein